MIFCTSVGNVVSLGSLHHCLRDYWTARVLDKWQIAAVEHRIIPDTTPLAEREKLQLLSLCTEISYCISRWFKLPATLFEFT